MSVSQDTQNKGVIKIIQDMLQSGESAEKILGTLKEMGISESQAQTLLMIGQTNTFAVLQGDIKQQVSDSISQKYPEFKKELTNTLTQANRQEQETIKLYVLGETEKKEAEFQEKTEKHVEKMLDISVSQDKKIDTIKLRLDDLGANYAKAVLGSTKWFFYLRVTAFVIGLSIAGFLLYKFINLAPGFSIDYLIYYIILGLIAAILFVLSLI